MTGINEALIDTNIIIELFDGNKRVADYLNQLETRYLPTVVLGELYVGVCLSENELENLTQVNYLLTIMEVITITTPIAVNYGMLKARLRKRGRPIPENDIWIAATCIQFSLPLISNDKHFDGIDGLQVINII